jgi:hypothetical protein
VGNDGGDGQESCGVTLVYKRLPEINRSDFLKEKIKIKKKIIIIIIIPKFSRRVQIPNLERLMMAVVEDFALVDGALQLLD